MDNIIKALVCFTLAGMAALVTAYATTMLVVSTLTLCFTGVAGIVKLMLRF